MTENYQIVPWYNSEEWHKVYNDLSIASADNQEALNLLLIWKARCPSLPSGIESTLSLLQVHVQDVLKETEDMANDQLIRLAYSSAIMRFVNHMLDTETAKGTSLYKAAKSLGVPDWIVDLRHDTAHSNNLPSLTLLREACVISLKWLQKNYWDKHKEYIQDYLVGQKVTENVDGSKVAALINFAMSLSICAHSHCKIKKLSQIPDMDMKESIVNDATDLFGYQIDFSNLKAIHIISLVDLTNEEFKKVLKGRDVSTYLNEVLLGEDSLFLSRELLQHFGEKNTKNKLKNNYMQCFEVLLTMLHTNELILDFLISLIRITQCNESDSFKAQLAALWVAEILAALNKSKLFIQKLKKMHVDEIKSKTKNELRQLYHHWFPNDTANHLVLDLTTPVPTELTDINFIQPIIATYNPYLNHFVKNLLDLVEPPLASIVKQRICKLAELISAPEKFPKSPTSKIYTVNDLKSAEDSHDDSIDIIENDGDIEVVCAVNPQADVTSGIWRLASPDHNWSACPLGELPWRRMAKTDGVTEMGP